MIDYHVHTKHSVDARDSMAVLLKRARELGIRELGFADHLDLNPADQGYMALDIPRYLAEIESLEPSDDVVVRAGVEVGEPHIYERKVAGLLKGRDIDFIIGGVHWVDDALVGTDRFFDRYDDPVRAYLEEVRSMVETGDLDIVAHLDFPCRYMAARGEMWDPPKTRDLTEDILGIIIERGLALEVNTGSYMRGLERPHPPAEVLTWYRDMGGRRITLGSDAHSVSALGDSVPRAMKLLAEIGFDTVTGFCGRQSYPIPLNSA